MNEENIGKILNSITAEVLSFSLSKLKEKNIFNENNAAASVMTIATNFSATAIKIANKMSGVPIEIFEHMFKENISKLLLEKDKKE